MFFEVLLAASALTPTSYDQLRTMALAEESQLAADQRDSFYSPKLRLFNEALPSCYSDRMSRRGIEFKAVAVTQSGRIKDVVLATESAGATCIARQLRRSKLPPMQNTPGYIYFETTFAPP